MNRKAHIFWMAFVVWSNLLFLQAGLEWVRKDQIYHARFKDTGYQAVYDFQNTGDFPVRITGSRTTCGCTTVVDTEKELGPGEKGDIRVNFEFGHRKGRQVKSIQLDTDDPEMPVVMLSLVVYIPSIIKVKPAFVFWYVGDSVAPKTIDIEMVFPERLTLEPLQISDERFSSQILPLKEEKKVQIQITPISTETACQATLRIPVKNAEGDTREFKAYARIIQNKKGRRRNVSKSRS